jgi:hypothetical protein
MSDTDLLVAVRVELKELKAILSNWFASQYFPKFFAIVRGYQYHHEDILEMYKEGHETLDAAVKSLIDAYRHPEVTPKKIEVLEIAGPMILSKQEVDTYRVALRLYYEAKKENEEVAKELDELKTLPEHHMSEK